MIRLRTLWAVLYSLCVILSASAVTPARLEIELWINLEPVVTEENDDEYPLSQEAAARKLLEEARRIVSSMVYGCTFVYTPADSAHRVAEVFDLLPVAEVAWGDPGLTVRQTRVVGTRLYAVVDYALVEFQQSRREAWSSGAIPRSTGMGSANVFLGHGERITAFENAMKEAVRGYLRPREPNKPREVRGEVLVWDSPNTQMSAGEYTTRVTIKLRIDEIIPYRLGS